MTTIQQVNDYLSEHISDPVPKYIFIKEILNKHSASAEYKNAYGEMKQSKWYRELADDQWENGSWGMFHGGDVKAQKRQKFPCTEAALRRARELSLTKDDPIIAKCITLMVKYALREEPYPDWIEKHKDEGEGHLLSIPFGVSANINMFDPGNPIIKPYRDVAVEITKEAFAEGNYNEEAFDKAIRDYRVPGYCKPGNAFSLMLLCNCDCMGGVLQRQYLNYVWNKKDGIMYISNYQLTVKRNTEDDCRQVEALKRHVEDKDFYSWLSILELFSRFSLFHELMERGVLSHLLYEADRLIHGDIDLPKPPGGHVKPCGHAVNGRYSESWRDKNKQKTDMVLRIARLLTVCPFC